MTEGFAVPGWVVVAAAFIVMGSIAFVVFRAWRRAKANEAL